MALKSSAFSLVELIIAMALSLAIIVVLYSGFRVAAQTVAITDRLSLENKLLAAGVVIAMDEVDRWQALDRPGHQPLRTSPPFNAVQPRNGGYANDGADWQRLPQPFTSFASSWPSSGSSTPYDPVWLPSDPQTWYRGDGGLATVTYAYSGPLEHVSQSAFGNYALFSCAGSPVIVGPSIASAVTTPTTSTWLPRQHKGLKYGLGFYGWLSYLPANAMVDYYDVDERPTHAGLPLKPFELRNLVPFATAQPARISDHRQCGRGAMQAGFGSGHLLSGAERAVSRSFFLATTQTGIDAWQPGDTPDTQRRRCMVNRLLSSGNRVGFETINWHSLLLDGLRSPDNLIRSKPDHWPEVQVDVRRTMAFGIQLNLCTIRQVDPLTGRTTELTFSMGGTTLRGARISRGLDQ